MRQGGRKSTELGREAQESTMGTLGPREWAGSKEMRSFWLEGISLLEEQ